MRTLVRKTLRHDEKTIWYIEGGEGKPLLFIHGWGVSPIAYKEPLEALAEHFHVIAPFFRDTGSLEAWNKRISFIITALDLKKTLIVGHSSAGIPVVRFASSHKDIGGVIIIDGMGIHNNFSIRQWFLLWFGHVSKLFSPATHHSFTFLITLTQDFFWQIIRYPRSLYYEATDALTTDISESLSQIHVPLLILWGKEDDLLPVVDAYRMKISDTNAELRILPGGHDWIKLHPEVLSKEVHQFAKERNL